MTAKKMFEKIGYKQRTNSDNWVIYTLCYGDDIRFELRFNKKRQEIEIWSKHIIDATLDAYEVKAIYKQIKELKWHKPLYKRLKNEQN